MSISAKPQMQPAGKMTFDAFMAWYETREGHWELHEGVPVRKHDPAKGQGERIRHLEVKYRIARALEEALHKQKKKCFMLPDGATVKISEFIAYEPDALVYCGERLDGDALVVPEPLIVVEVLSPSTAYKDVSDKLEDYFKLACVQHYLIIDPKIGHITLHYRVGGLIETRAVHGPVLDMDPPGLKVNIENLFI